MGIQFAPTAYPILASQGGMNCPSIVAYGGSGNGTFDNSSALAAALTVTGTVSFPPGTFYFASAQALTVLASSSIGLYGSGQDLTILKFPAGTDGLDITVTGPYASVHIRDLTIETTDNTGGYSAIKLIQATASIANPANTAQSDISYVTTRGSDGYAGTEYWGVGVNVDSVSNINFIGDLFVGTNSYEGIGVSLVGTSAAKGVVYNFIGTTANYLNYGIEYGSYIQGVTISAGSNFTADNYGVYVPSGGLNVDELIVADTQFNCFTAGIYDGTGVPNLQIADDVLFIIQANATGVALTAAYAFSVKGSFNGSSLTTSNGIAVANTTVGGTIEGRFFNLDVAISLAATASNVQVSLASVFANNTTNFADLGTNNNSNLAPAPNILINPSMEIDQSNEGTSVGTASSYIVDGWSSILSDTGGWTLSILERVADGPPGFVNAIKLTIGTAANPAAADKCELQQPIEANDLVNLGFGTSSAKALSYRIWIKSSISNAVFGLTFANTLRTRTFTVNCSVPTANTWTECRGVIRGDTGGTWVTSGTAQGASFIVTPFAGSNFVGTPNVWGSSTYITSSQTNLCTTAGATFEMTGAKLEISPMPTPFVRRPYEQEFGLVQRYYRKTFPPGTKPAQNAGIAGAICAQNPMASGEPSFYWSFGAGAPMRITPTITTYNPSASNANWRDVTAGADVAVSVDPASATGPDGVLLATGATVAAQGDVLCIHAVANARM